MVKTKKPIKILFIFIGFIIIFIVFIALFKSNYNQNNDLISAKKEKFNYSSCFNKDMYDMQYLGLKKNEILFMDSKKNNTISSYNFQNDIVNDIYKSSKDTVFISTCTTDLGIVILECIYHENGLKFRINFLNTINQDYNYTNIYNGQSNKIPYMYVANETIFINYDINNISKLEAINLVTLESMIIDTKEFSVINGQYSGSVIMYCGGNDSVIYYQILNPNNELLEQTSSIKIVKYSLDENKFISEFDANSIALHITGSSKYLLTSEYNYDYPIDNSGLIFKMNTPEKYDKFITIPFIKSGRDITNSKILNDSLILFSNPEYYYCYDLDNDNYIVRKISNTRASNLQFENNSISYLEFYEKNWVLNTITIKN